MPILQQHGITQANELVNLNDFFINHILSDLKSANSKWIGMILNTKTNNKSFSSFHSDLKHFVITVNEFPVLKADAIKYVMIFRSQVGPLFFC